MLLQEGAVFGLGFGVFGGDDHGGGDLVVLIQVEELDAGGAAACGADGLGVDADDLAELADEHHLRGVVHELDGGDLAGFGAGLHVDDAGSAAGLEAVAVDVGALAEAVFGDGEDEAGGEAELFVELVQLGAGRRGGGGDVRGVAFEDERGVGGLIHGVFQLGGEAEGFGALAALLFTGFGRGGDGGADDVVGFAEVDAAVAGGGASHGAEILLVEADGHAVMGGEEDDVLAVGDAGGDELVILVDVDGDDAAAHDV